MRAQLLTPNIEGTNATPLTLVHKKLLTITLFGLVCLLVLALVLVTLTSPSPNAPKFVPLRSPLTGTYAQMDYDWGGAVPVQDGNVWIETWSSPTNWHCYLYNVTDRLLVGELFRATPIFSYPDQSKLLCEGYSLEGSWRWKLSRWLDKFPPGKALARKINQVETFWVLNMKDGSAEPVGSVSQLPGSGSSFVPSPGFRYGVNRPTTSLGGHELFLCDLASNLFTKITISGQLVGWWDEHTLLVHDEGNNLVLTDVTTHQTNTLLSAEATAEFMQKIGLPRGSADKGWWGSNWSGRGYDFFLTLESEKNWGESFLLKLDRSERTLKVVKRNFKSQHLGFLDAEATHYLYEGENGVRGRGGNGGVYLRDLSDDSLKTLVPPDNAGQYSLARFCGDGVIYIRKNVLWRVDLNGSNNAPLFQPGASTFGGRQKPR